MRVLIFLLSIQVLNASGSEITFEGKDPECKILQGTAEVVRVEKGDANTLHLALKHNNRCELDSDSPLLLYWKMGKKKIGQLTPCEGLSNVEKKFFNLENLKVINNERVTFNFDEILKLENYTPNRELSSEVTIAIRAGESGRCITEASLVIDGGHFQFDLVRATMRFFSLHKLEIISKQNGESILFSK